MKAQLLQRLAPGPASSAIPIPAWETASAARSVSDGHEARTFARRETARLSRRKIAQLYRTKLHTHQTLDAEPERFAAAIDDVNRRLTARIDELGLPRDADPPVPGVLPEPGVLAELPQPWRGERPGCLTFERDRPGGGRKVGPEREAGDRLAGGRHYG